VRTGKPQVPPLRTPDFLSKLVALTIFMRLSLRKAAHTAMSSAAWEEIRVRSGRDDNSVARKRLKSGHKNGCWWSHRTVIPTGA
jgi:hypothetical protein